MRSRGMSCLVWGIFFIASLLISTERSSAANCALYVRSITGVALFGAAGGWWNQAEGRYLRGQLPAVEAILVFKRTGHMRSGHVALVTKVVSAREILVDHANWYHGRVNRSMSVIDTSPNNDWTTVAVMELSAGKHGRDNPTFGFIYPVTASAEQAGLVHLVVATEDLGGPAPRRPERTNQRR
jgi:surface antigen